MSEPQAGRPQRASEPGDGAAARLAAHRGRGYRHPVPPARFVTDTSLAFLARRLIVLGYDVAVIPGARMVELFVAGRRERRTVLTLSARHPRKFSDVAAIVVPRDDAPSALRTIVAAHAPAGEPFSRCTGCNAALQSRHPMEARGEVPGRVLRGARTLHYCPVCGKWYWEGTHTARLRAWLERALGRPVPGAGMPGADAPPADSR